MIESFPIAFAHEQGIFERRGLRTELVGFTRLQDRNVSLRTGVVHGAVSDITSILLLLADEAPLRITSTAYEPIDDSRRYALLASPFSYLTSLEQLLGRLDGSARNTIGIQRKTDVEFETDRLLAAQGFQVDAKQQYADFPDLLQLANLIGAGSWLAGVLPEPAAAYLEFITEAAGDPVVTLAEYKNLDLVPSIVVFQNALIEGDPELIASFYAGYREVIARIGSMPREQLVDVGVDSALAFFFPGVKREELPPGAEEFIQDYLIPAFPQPRALAPEEYRQVSEWALAKGFISSNVPFDAAFTDRFSE